MTILTESERVTALTYYNRGWSLPEIASELVKKRAEKLKWEMRSEVEYVIAHRFASSEKERGCDKTLQEIINKRLARGDVEEDGFIHRVRARPVHIYPKDLRAQGSY